MNVRRCFHCEPNVPPADAAGVDGASQARSKRRGATFWALYSLYLLLVAWSGTWVFGVIRWSLNSALPPNTDVWTSFYQEIEHTGVRRVSCERDDDQVDVLLLGGSVLEQVGSELDLRLREHFGDRVRVFNLARASHTSRDSLLKYRLLRDRAFDLIVVYDGINDVRMNCCAADQFRDDYTHCGWYNSIQRRTTAGRETITPLAMSDLQRLIDLGQPRTPRQLDFGDDLRTPPAFERNIREIVEIAASAGQPVLLATFAYHLPEDYSRDRFERGELDFGGGDFRLPVELWGKPHNVARTLDAHNAVIRRIAEETPQVMLCDMERGLPRSGRVFSDVCHLTPEGIREFASRMTKSLRPWLEVTRGTPR